MIPRLLLGLFLAVLMLITGVSTYLYIGGRQSKLAIAPLKPTAVQPAAHAFVLPGTLYMSQAGALYSLNSGRFHQLTTADGWMMPSLTPDGNMVAVKRSGFWSDVYVLNRFGKPLRQVTFNQAPRRSYDTGDNHWSFYPVVTPDGKTLYMSYDQPKAGYEVDMSIWAMPYSGSIRQGKVWTDENAAPGYTGGDIQPILVPGGVIYTRYDRAPDGSIISQLWYTNRAGSFGKALTSGAEDCRSPALSPDQTHLAMICTYTKQISNLMIATWAGSNIGPRQAVVSDQMVAQPTWAPDGSGLAYMAPALLDGPFQLWFMPRSGYLPPIPSPVPTPSVIPGGPEGSPSPSAAASPTPAPPPVKPIQITSSVGLDASSTMAWAP